MRKKRMLAMVLTLVMILSLAACGSSGGEEPADAKETEKKTEAPKEKATEAPKETETKAPEKEQAAGEDPQIPDYEYVQPAGETFDIATYYNDLGVECSFKLRATGGVVNVLDDMTTTLPVPKDKYTIGFSVYFTVDEVGAMMLDSMKAHAEAAGIELLVNDANYDQDAQNAAIEQWILQDVDGVILAPCDFTGVQGSLDALKEAGIPCATLNPALVSEADSVVMSECKEQGVMAGKLLLDHLQENNVEMKGTIIYQSLPFVHPNAATRADGFKSVFADYPDVEIVELTGSTPEEHYTAFEGALLAYPDMIGAFGLYSSATVGMINAKKANGSDIPITSIDNDKPILQAIYEGDCLGSACYSAAAPTFYCMSAIINLLNGVDVPSAYFYENRLVTKDNVEEMFEHYYDGKTLADYIAGETE
ncbi:MAG: substrate-binding domain-containing protein [Lachnospiraceae bacterium]|nr:substrate-binding domain-containing protein [Lachnospiraceae bacterium]